MKVIADDIVKNLSLLIADELECMQRERHFPGSDADRMDSKIEEHYKRATKLREIRTQLEDLMTEEV